MNTVATVVLPLAAGAKYDREHAAFRDMLSALLQTHPGQFVAVHDGQVIAAGPDRLAVVRAAFQQAGLADLHVGYVGAESDDIARSGLRRDLSARPIGP